MKESLGDLLDQGANSIDPPHFDVPDLVAEVERRLVRRRLTTLAASSVALAVVGVGAFLLGVDRERPTPAPPGPSVSGALGTPRPLVYAEGETIHFGEQTIDAGAAVVFVEATDDGVVFVSEDDYRPGGSPQIAPLWFTDGASPEKIGETDVHHIYDFAVATANPGSLIAWLAVAPGTDTSLPHDEMVVVYDSRLRRIVARVPAAADSDPSTIEEIGQIAVNGDRVYWEDRNETVVTRYDVSTGIREPASWEAYHADLADNPRMLAFGNASDQAAPPPVVAQRLAAFMQKGNRLVPTNSIHTGAERHELPTTLLDGQPLHLRVPKGYHPVTNSFTVVQWLDDGHLVLFGYYEHSEMPMHLGDILVCPVPSGTCQVVVPAADATPYVPPGEVY